MCLASEHLGRYAEGYFAMCERLADQVIIGSDAENLSTDYMGGFVAGYKFSNPDEKPPVIRAYESLLSRRVQKLGNSSDGPQYL